MADLSKLAVLIDADNTQPAIAGPLLAEIAKYGVANVKRIYGDWTTDNLNGWKKVLVQHAIQPIQQFGYTTGKNATDSAMIIDAMDLLYTGRFDGFCLVSSDSDFTRLASRLREAGLTVYGFGERKTPTSLRAACDLFVYLDVLRGAGKAAKPIEPPPAPAAKVSTKAAAKGKKAAAPAAAAKPAAKEEAPRAVEVAAKAETHPDPKADAELKDLFVAAVEDAAGQDGWANPDRVRSLMINRRSDFDHRSYGFRKFIDLALALDLFDTDERPSPDGKQRIQFLRDRRGKP
ncbi:MAG TPA: NYN domain-containing protein [Solimonas sp.]